MFVVLCCIVGPCDGGGSVVGVPTLSLVRRRPPDIRIYVAVSGWHFVVPSAFLAPPNVYLSQSRSLARVSSRVF